MSSNFKIEEIKKIFRKKIKDRNKIKGISFSKIEKGPKIHKTHKKDLSFKEKITEEAFKNSMRQYSKLKKIIYLNEKKYEEIQKHEEFQKKRIKELQYDLNYTNITKLLDLAFNQNNPFKDNGKVVKKIIKVNNQNRVIDKNRQKQIVKIALYKNIRSNIDDYSEIFRKIENSKKNLEKMLNDKNNNKNKKSRKLNKSKSLILNYSNLNKYKNSKNLNKSIYNKNLSEKIEYENNSLFPSISQLKDQNEIFNDFKEETDKSLKSIKHENNIKITKLKKTSSSFVNINKSDNNKSCIQIKKPLLLKKHFKHKLKYFVINNDVQKLNLSQIKLENDSSKKSFMNESIKKCIDNIEDLFIKFNKIKSDSEKLNIDYKMRNRSSFQNLDDMVNIKEEMKLDLLKDKYLKNCSSQSKFKNNSIKKSKLITIVNSIMDNDEL
jgi:hypothetical protein